MYQFICQEKIEYVSISITIQGLLSVTTVTVPMTHPHNPEISDNIGYIENNFSAHSHDPCRSSNLCENRNCLKLYLECRCFVRRKCQTP